MLVNSHVAGKLLVSNFGYRLVQWARTMVLSHCI